MRLKNMNLFNFLNQKKDNEEIVFESIISSSYESLSIQILAVHIAISYIADTISKCDFNFYINGIKQKFSELDYIFNISPNINISATTMKRNLIFKLFLDGEALSFEHKGKLFLADSFFIEHFPLEEDKFKNISILNEEKVFNKNASEVFYFTLDNKEVVQLIDELFIEYKSIIDYSIENYKSHYKEKYKLKIDRTQYDDPGFQKLYDNIIKKQIKEFIENPKSVYPEYKGFSLEYIDTKNNTTNNSNDILNLKKDMFETVAIAFKMPVSFLYGNMTNVKDLICSYLTFAIEPVKKMIETEITRKYFTKAEYSKKSYCVIDTSKILHIDIFEVADKIEKLISSGHSNIDEVREITGHEALNTEFSSQYWMTKNFSKIEELLNSIESSKGGE